MDRQSILLSPNFPGPHEFHNFMGKVRIQQNTFFQSFINLFYFYASGGGWGMSHLCLFKNYEFSLGVVPPISIYPSLLSAYTPHSYQRDISSFIYPSLLSAYTPHSYQQGYFIFHIPLTPISFAKLLNEFRSYFLLASLNYLMNLGAISY